MCRHALAVRRTPLGKAVVGTVPKSDTHFCGAGLDPPNDDACILMVVYRIAYNALTAKELANWSRVCIARVFKASHDDRMRYDAGSSQRAGARAGGWGAQV